MRTRAEVLVGGAGVTGLVAALGFADAGADVVMVGPDSGETAPQGPCGARTYALIPAVVDLLRQLGVWQRVDGARCGEFDAIEIEDAGSGAALAFSPPVTHETAMGWIVEHDNLAHALRTSVKATTVRWIDDTLTGLHTNESGRHQVACAGGSTVDAGLLVAADGAASRLRDALGIDATASPYDARACVVNVRTERPHEAVARQRFLASGPLAFLPLAAPNEVSIVWSMDAGLAAEISALARSAFDARLAAAFDHRLGAVESLTERQYFDLARLRTTRMTARNAALVGDAAHVIHPLAGQGLNLGLLDVRALVRCVGAARSGTPWPRARDLSAYARWRSFEAHKLGLATDALNRLFLRTEPAVCAIRGAGLRATNALRPLARWFAAEAMGAHEFAGYPQHMESV